MKSGKCIKCVANHFGPECIKCSQACNDGGCDKGTG